MNYELEGERLLPIMRCCGVADVEGTSVLASSKINQALQGIFIPHKGKEHGELPTEFPSHQYPSHVNV